MSGHDGMPPAGLERALELVADQAGEKDLAQTAWRRGRTVRRRRHAVVGGAAAGVIAVGAMTVAVLAPERPVDGPAADVDLPVVTSTLTPAQLRAARVQTALQAGCLSDKGWHVTVDKDTGRWWGAERRPGAEPTADLGTDLDACESLLGRGPTIQVGTTDAAIDDARRDTMAAVYAEYRDVAGCLINTMGLAVTVPDQESFLHEYSLTGAIPWHPYLPIVGGGHLERTAQQCPVAATWDTP